MEGEVLAKGIYRTHETMRISGNPLDIRITSDLPPLFGDSRKERIGYDLVRLAKGHSGWVAVSAEILFGAQGLEHHLETVHGMRADGYVVIISDKSGSFLEPTQELADFYLGQQP